MVFGKKNIFFLKKRSLYVGLLFFVFTFKIFAFETEVKFFVTKQETAAIKYGDEVLQLLYEYRKEVEKQAYQNTLMLCEGYRRAKSLGPHPAHGKYMFTASEAASAWGKVLAEGANQIFSGTFGLKADFLNYGKYGMFDWISWYQSMYTMYLVNSFGFLSGAVHCLGTMDESKIEKFAIAIVDADIAASAVTTSGGILVSFFVPELLFPKIIQATKFVFRPASRLINYLSVRVTKLPIKIAGIFVGGVLADNFLLYLKNKDEYQNELQDLIDPNGHNSKKSLKRKRFILLTKTFEIFYQQYQKEKKLIQTSSELCLNCKDIYLPYYEYIKLNYNVKLLSELNTDYNNLSSQYFLSEEDKIYFDLLKSYLPILNEHIKKFKLIQ